MGSRSSDSKKARKAGGPKHIKDCDAVAEYDDDVPLDVVQKAINSSIVPKSLKKTTRKAPKTKPQKKVDLQLLVLFNKPRKAQDTTTAPEVAVRQTDNTARNSNCVELPSIYRQSERMSNRGGLCLFEETQEEHSQLMEEMGKAPEEVELERHESGSELEPESETH